MMLRPLCLACATSLSPMLAAAHPHIFVEAQVSLVTDGAGQVTGVRLTWTYDEFFSFLLTSELGIDPDGDMQLNPEEQQALADYVLDWPADFGGDLLVMQNGVPLPLAPRAEAQALFRDGRIVESHLRPLAAAADARAAEVQVQVFDPFYYVAYEVRGEIGVENGEGCQTTYLPADLNAAYSLVDELLYGRPASDVGPDEYFPEVGQAFADTIGLRCAG
jgi:ABC-type uncharacterized transport system substrate-binding protein